MSEIIVGLGERSYPIVVESGCSKKIGAELKKNNYAKRYCVVSDDKVAGLYGQELIETMRSAGLD